MNRIIRIIILILTVLTIYGWFSLPDRSWATLGPNIVIAGIQLIIGLVIAEVFLVYYRRRRVRDVAGYHIGGSMVTINYTLSRLAVSFEIHSARNLLKNFEPELDHLSKDIEEIQQQYQALLDFETASLLEQIRTDLWMMSRSSNSYSHMDNNFIHDLADRAQNIHKNTRKLGKQYSHVWFSDRDATIDKWIKQTNRLRLENEAIEPLRA